MAGRFEGKVAIVTGGGRGIGEATARLLAAEGAAVVVNDLGGAVGGGGSDAAVASALADEIVAAGGTAIASGADVADYAGARSAVEAAVAAFGRVDVLVNAAGIVRHGLIDELDEEAWDQLLRVNVRSAYAMVHHVAPHMKAQGSGAVVSIGSPSGFGHKGMAAYAASKEALVAFTRCIARDLGEHGVRANLVRPCAPTRMGGLPEVMDDMIRSRAELDVPAVGNQWLPGMNGEQPASTTANAAAAIAWLCLPASAALNGREIYIAGGHMALCAEPELVRSRFNAQGWDLETLASDAVSAHFTYGQSNAFAPPG